MRNLSVRTRPGTLALPWTLGSMHRQLEDWMDRAFDGPFGDYLEPRLALNPRIDFAETEDSYELSADLPGFEEKDVDVSLSDDVLTIKGERISENGDGDRNLHLSERSYGTFRRVLKIPQDVDSGAVEAQLSNGVLQVRLPKTKDVPATTRQIKVKSK